MEKKSLVNVCDEIPDEKVLPTTSDPMNTIGPDQDSRDVVQHDNSEMDFGKMRKREGAYGQNLQTINHPGLVTVTMEDISRPIGNGASTKDTNTSEDPDMHLGEVEEPYSSSFGPDPVREDEDKKYMIQTDASIKLLPTTDHKSFKCLSDMFIRSASLNGHNISIKSIDSCGDAISALFKSSIRPNDYTIATSSKIDNIDYLVKFAAVDGVVSVTIEQPLFTTKTYPLSSIINKFVAVALPDQEVNLENENMYTDGDEQRQDRSIQKDPLQ